MVTLSLKPACFLIHQDVNEPLCKLLRHDSSHHALPSLADYPLLTVVLSEAALHQVFPHSREKGNSYDACPQQGSYKMTSYGFILTMMFLKTGSLDAALELSM